VATLSLESAEDLDSRFTIALDELFTESPIRQQVVVDLQGMFPVGAWLMARRRQQDSSTVGTIVVDRQALYRQSSSGYVDAVGHG
jgi:hypothetical protein